MNGGTSWDYCPISYFGSNVAEFNPVSERNNGCNRDNGCSNSSISLEILPDDILERILSFLPVACIFRAASACKRWYSLVFSRRHIWAHKLQQKPWYFMFISSETAAGYAYDPIFRKWYNFELPCQGKSNWLISSSCGLVCFMDNDSRSKIFVCNPIARSWKGIEAPPGVKFPDYSALALSLNKECQNYNIVVAKSKQMPGDFLQWDFSIHIYDSESRSWVTNFTEVLMGWRGGDESVICNGVLYCLIYSAGMVGINEIRHGLIMYDLSARSSQASLMCMAIPVPCSLTCGRLMNLNDRLLMVGGMGKHGRPDIIKGIGIWELHKKEWREVAQMPHRFFQGFGEFDDVFASSGADDLIYIHSYGTPVLLVFDMSHKEWKWSLKCPVTKRFPLQLFTGFCFEPRLEVAS